MTVISLILQSHSETGAQRPQLPVNGALRDTAAGYLLRLDANPPLEATLTLTNPEAQDAVVAFTGYRADGTRLVGRSVTSRLSGGATSRFEVPLLAPPGGDTLMLRAQGHVLATELLTQLDGRKAEVVPVVQEQSRQLVFPPLLRGDQQHRKIVLLNPASSSASVQVAVLDRAGSALAQSVEFSLAPLQTLAVPLADLFSPDTMRQLATVRVSATTPILGLQFIDAPAWDLIALPALTATSREWSFPIVHHGGGIELWTSVNVFNPGAVSVTLTIEAFDDAAVPLGIVDATTVLPESVQSMTTANLGGRIPPQTAVLKVSADTPVGGYVVFGALNERGAAAAVGLRSEDRDAAGIRLVGSANGSVLKAYPVVRRPGGALESTARRFGEREWVATATVQPVGSSATSVASVAEADIVFTGTSPAVPGSGGALSLHMGEKTFLWTSVDPILGSIDTGVFAPAAKWNFLSGAPDRLVFIGQGGGATFYGNVLFSPYNRAVVDVTKGQARVRYVLTWPPVCACLVCPIAQDGPEKDVTIDLDIHNGQAGPEVAEDKEETVGAFTVTNLNDTDGDGKVDAGDDDKEVKATPNGRDEMDLMQLVLRKPVPDLGGKAVLKVVSGDVKFWEKSTKETEITDREFATANLPRTVWVEVRAPSNALRDIVIELQYKECKDTVKATGIWVEKTRFRNDTDAGVDTPSNLTEDTVGTTVKVVNAALFATGQPIFLKDLDGEERTTITAIAGNTITVSALTRVYQKDRNGRVEHREDRHTLSIDADGTDIRETFEELEVPLGARSANPIGNGMEMEFTVKPAGIGAEPGILFDITRQEEAKIWRVVGGVTREDESRTFPAKEEEPNDDTNAPDEDEDDDPKNNHIYVIDQPRLGSSTVADYMVFRANFREFVRVLVNGGTFALPRETLVIGSRASNKVPWRSWIEVSKGPDGKWHRLGFPFDEIVEGNKPIGNPPGQEPVAMVKPVAPVTRVITAITR
jgi:hypothetical protein